MQRRIALVVPEVQIDASAEHPRHRGLRAKVDGVRDPTAADERVLAVRERLHLRGKCLERGWIP